MTLSLAVTDAGSGAAAISIQGSDSGMTNTIYWAPQYAAVNGVLDDIPWTLAGTRVGDGSLTVNLIPGYYFFTALGKVSGVLTLSNAVNLQLISDGTNPHYNSLTTIRDKIRALNLDGIPSKNILVRWMPRALNNLDTYPGIWICPGGIEGQPFSLNAADDFDYPCIVFIYDKQNQDYDGNIRRNLGWRHDIRLLFIHKPLGVFGINTVKFGPKLIFDPNFFSNQLYVSTLVLLCTSREDR